MSNTIRVKCVKEGTKLRIRIISNGYNSNANCQFPRDIRIDGAEYDVPATNVTFSENAQKKFFYRIKKGAIVMLDIQATASAIAHIFENEDEDCAVCYENAKSVVFAPCGHYCCCEECATIIKTTKGNCPLCRLQIGRIVLRSQIAF